MNFELTPKKAWGPIGFLEALTLIFVIARIIGFINWGWWLVLSPILIPFALVIIVTGTAVLIGLIIAIIRGG